MAYATGLVPDTIEDLLMPYRLLTTRLQAELARERNEGRRHELELEITVLLALIEILEKVDSLVASIAHKEQQ